MNLCVAPYYNATHSATTRLRPGCFVVVRLTWELYEFPSSFPCSSVTETCLRLKNTISMAVFEIRRFL